MQFDNILLAKVEAKKFLEKVKDYEERYKHDKEFRFICQVVGFKETGALKRASMDLSRALSQMRK